MGSSHYNPEAIRLAKENDVILFTLVPHTTHEMQPLDTSVFAPLKVHWRDACHSFMQQNPGKVVTKYEFSTLLAEAWLKTMSPAPIINGFKYCGVFPFDPEVVLRKCTSYTAAVSTNTGSSDQASKSTSTITSGEASNSTPGDAPNCSVANSFSSESVAPNSEEPRDQTFTEEEERRFQIRFDENYDLYTPRYVAWLEVNHPAALPEDRYRLTTSLNDSDGYPSLTDLFSYVPSCEPVLPESLPTSSATQAPTSSASSPATQAPTSSPGAQGPTSSASSPGTHTPTSSASSPGTQAPTSSASSPATQAATSFVSSPGTLAPTSSASSPATQAPTSSPGAQGPTSSVSSPGTHTPTSSASSPATQAPTSSASSPGTQAPTSSASSPGSHTPTSPTGSTATSVSKPSHHISKYLVQYIPVTPNRTRDAKRVAGERVLTSAEGLAKLKEKEDKKLKEAEEKRKQEERESKRKQKEELARKKAEEKAKKAKQRAEEKAQKANARTAGKQAPKRSTGPHRKAKKASKQALSSDSPSTSSSLPGPSTSSDSPSTSTSLPGPSTSPGSQSTSTSLSGPSFGTSTPASDTNYECCECLETYEDDVHFGRGE